MAVTSIPLTYRFATVLLPFLALSQPYATPPSAECPYLMGADWCSLRFPPPGRRSRSFLTIHHSDVACPILVLRYHDDLTPVLTSEIVKKLAKGMSATSAKIVEVCRSRDTLPSPTPPVSLSPRLPVSPPPRLPVSLSPSPILSCSGHLAASHLCPALSQLWQSTFTCQHQFCQSTATGPHDRPLVLGMRWMRSGGGGCLVGGWADGVTPSLAGHHQLDAA